MKIKLRSKKVSNGNESLYLEYYKGYTKTPEGKIKHNREFEFLNLYFKSKPKNPIEKVENKNTLAFANKILIQRQADINSGKYGIPSTLKLNVNFLEYFNSLITKRNFHRNWITTYKYLQDYCNSETTFKDIDEKFCEGFLEYLYHVITKMGNNLSKNTVYAYFSKFNACLNKAYKEKLILQNPIKFIESVKKQETRREYLTFDEIKSLAQTECTNDILKRAFLFSCLTGLRWSDINKLTWSDIQNFNGGYRIIFTQKKTKGIEYLDISNQAYDLLGTSESDNQRIFEGLNYSIFMNRLLRKWCEKAKINKYISYHTSRHTFAVLQLTLGTDIYTVSKLLGHRDLTSTQVYAKIVDEKKKEAINRIPEIKINFNK
ncbi:MAG: site-specific integrase [Ignavibacteriae bacterium]|nr:site-specific integrase [Ignavibacteriota bacterium]